MLYLDFQCTTAIREAVQRIEEAQAALDPFISLPYEFSGELKRAVLAESVHYSTRIEGNTLTLEQVHGVLAGQAVSAPADEVQEVENYRDAMSFAQTLATEQGFVITEETIRTIHFLISKNLSRDYAPGRYRTEQNLVVGRSAPTRVFFPPPPSEVAALMGELVQWLNSPQERPAPIKAALAHLDLAAIHPFLDGNGRTARVLESLVMYASGYRHEELVSLETFYEQNRQAYYQALSSALGPHYAPPRDVTSWVEYHTQAHAQQSQAAVDNFREFSRQVNRLIAALVPFRLTEHQMVCAWMACRAGGLANRYYREGTGRSAQGAITDFNTLIRKGLLARTGGGRSTMYVPSDTLRRIYSDIIAEAPGQPTPDAPPGPGPE